MRDLDQKPYTSEEFRVASFFAQRGTGGGDDPIGAMLASYAYVVEQRNRMQAAIRPALALLERVPPSGSDDIHIDTIKQGLRDALT